MLRYEAAMHNEPVRSTSIRALIGPSIRSHFPAGKPGPRKNQESAKMDRLSRRKRSARWLFTGLLFCGTSWQGEPARAQTTTTKKDPSSAPTKGQKRADGADARTETKTRPAANAEQAKHQAPAKAAEPRREPSEAYKESLRKTLEKRRQRRAQRAQAQGLDDARPVGAIVPWPMPPALIIRQTPEVHGEMNSLLGQLRRAGQ